MAWPLSLDVALREPERFAHGQHDLVAHQVDPRHLLGDRVLDLDAFVHLQEIVVPLLIHDELDGAGVGVVGLFGDADGRLAHLLAQLLELGFSISGEGHLLDHLLVAALDGAIALAQGG